MPIIDRLKDRIAQFGPSSKETSIPLPGSGIAGGIPFDDEMPISKPAIVFHFLQIFFSFLAVCCFASVASFQAHWKIGPSGLSGFAIFIGITGMVLSAVLLLVPVIYDKYNKLARLARAMRELRVAFILAISGCIWLLLISFITVISAFTQPGCKNPDNDPHEKLGDDFKAQLPGWCRTKKAGSVFFWFAFAAWLATLGLAIKEWRSGKSRSPRDPPFTRPAYQPSLDEDVEAGGPMANRAQRFGRTDDDDEEEEDDHTLPPITPVSRPAAGRPSMDTYGAFDDPAPSGYGGGGGATSPGVSRTMQYADPYAAIRANLGDGGRPAGASSTPPSYEYQGYR